MKQKTNKLLIGIPEMGHDSLIRIYMRSKYPAAIRKFGGESCWLPWTEDEDQMRGYIEKCDGFLFPGGPDVSPVFYGEEEDPSRTYHRERDGMELPLMRLVLESGKPVLGICRGCQVLNVALGGSLHKDIKAISGTENHMEPKNRRKGSHKVLLREGSLLAQITGKKTLWVNTLHHQSVKLAGENLIITARSPNKIIEAIELKNSPFCIGVQWHPEHMTADAAAQRIFKAFLEQAGYKE